MDVKKLNNLSQENIDGQSIIEFLFFLPLILGVTYTLYLVNSSIQVSIVNQQYARAQTLFLTHNSPVYPRRGLQESLAKDNKNIMVIGVSQNLITAESSTNPEATVQRIVRPGAKDLGIDDEQIEPDRRGMIRIRTTTALCTQNNFVSVNGETVPALLSSELGEGTIFEYCRSQ